MQAIREKLGIPSGRAIIHVVLVQVIIYLVWNWISNMFTIPLVREIGFLVVFVAGLFAVAWYLPKLAPVWTGRKPREPQGTAYHPSRLEHDGVLWEDGGRDSWGGVRVIGPLCPKDYTPLSMKHNDKIEANLRYDTLISDSGFHSRLFCLECQTEYTLGNKPKKIQESHDEVAVLILGMRKRALENQAG